MLRRCNTVWGNATLVRSAPLVEVHRDVMFVPLAENMFLDHDRAWGIFDRNGQLIDAGGYFRGPERALVGQATHTDQSFENVPWAPEPHYVYGGPIINHYGHFVVTTFARFWWRMAGWGRAPALGPILLHSHGPTRHWLDLPYRAAMMDAIGISTNDFATFDRPVRIRSLTIPRTAFEEQNYVHTAMSRLCRHVGDKVLGNRARVPEDRPLYFSKAGLTGGVTRFSNEEAIVARLQSAGVDIVAPETMSFAEQLHLFATRSVIMGSSSSAFHTSIFLPPRARLICITPNDLLNSNFLLVDKINGNRADYVFPEAGSVQSRNSDGFLVNSHVNDPERVADELLEIIGT